MTAAPRRLWASLLLALVLAALTIAGVPLVRGVLGDFALGQSPNPYLIPGQILRTLVLTPLASLATAVFFLFPGFLVAALSGRRKSVGLWVIAGLGSALALNTAAVTLAELALGHVLAGRDYALFHAAVTLAVLLVLARRLRAGDSRVDLAGQGGTLLSAAALFLACLMLMAPKFYWENFSGDGSGSLQFTRNLIHSHWPFWSPDAGVIKQAPGLTSFLFVLPDAWFVRLWGEWEFSVRVMLPVGLALLLPVLTDLIAWGRPRQPGAVALVLLAMALLLYAFANTYSGGYHAWFGDSPMPVVRETLAMVAFMGYILAFLDNRRGLMVAAGLMAHFSIPTGGLWLLLWPAAVWLTWRPRPAAALRSSVLVLGLAGLASLLVPLLVRLLGLPMPGSEFSAAAVVERLRFVAFTDWNRFAFWAVPVGLAPVAALLAWPAQDRVARALTLLTALFFLFFYLQAYRVLLHHFIPAMIPPLVILWRQDWANRPWGQALTAAGLVASLPLAWPREMGMHAHDRAFAASIATEGPAFAGGPQADGERFRRFDPVALAAFHDLFTQLFPIGYGATEPGERFYGAPLVWWYYSEFPKAPGQPITYLVKPFADVRPEDGMLMARSGDYALFLRDPVAFERDRRQHLPYDTGAPLLATPRPVMFGRGGLWEPGWSGRKVIDLVRLVRAPKAKG